MKRKSLSINIILNVLRQTCTVLFPLVTFPYVARVLGTSNYGIFNYSVSFTNYFLLLASLGVNTYAIKEGAKIRETDRIDTFCSEVFSINVYSAILSYVLLLLVVFGSYKNQKYSIYIMLLSIGILATTIGADWINSIYEDYLYITVRYVLIQIISLVGIFAFVKNENALLLYVLIYVFSQYAGFIINVFYIRKYVRLRFIPHINIKHLIPILVLFANAIAIVIYVNSDIIILDLYVSKSQIGIYSFSTRIYSAVKQLVNAFIIVTIPRVSSTIASNYKEYCILIKKIFSVLILLLFPSAILLFFQAKECINFLGGEQYIQGESSLRILSIAMVFAILSSFISNNILFVNNKEKESLLSTIVSALINVGLNFLIIPVYGILAAAITTLIAEAGNFVIQAWFGRKLINYREYFNKDLCSVIIGSLVITIICTIYKYLNVKLTFRYEIVSVLTLGLICLVVYSLILFALGNTVFKRIVESFRNVIAKIQNKD